MNRNESTSVQKSTLREAAQQALEALELDAYGEPPRHERNAAIDALRAALAEPMQETNIKESLTTGSCIACGNRMTGSPESFVVATAEVGVTAPEGYSPQQVEALHPHKVGDKTSPPLADRIADCLVEDHIALMQENERLHAALAEPVQECPHGVTDGNCKECYGKATNSEPFTVYSVPLRCPNCASLQDQNTELDRKLAELERK